VQRFVVVRALALLPERRLTINQVTDSRKLTNRQIDSIKVRRQRNESPRNAPGARPKLQSPLRNRTSLAVRDNSRLETSRKAREVVEVVSHVLGRDLHVVHGPRGQGHVTWRVSFGTQGWDVAFAPGLVSGCRGAVDQEDGRRGGCWVASWTGQGRGEGGSVDGEWCISCEGVRGNRSLRYGSGGGEGEEERGGDRAHLERGDWNEGGCSEWVGTRGLERVSWNGGIATIVSERVSCWHERIDCL
jgi:hypothetical protein